MRRKVKTPRLNAVVTYGTVIGCVTKIDHDPSHTPQPLCHIVALNHPNLRVAVPQSRWNEIREVSGTEHIESILDTLNENPRKIVDVLKKTLKKNNRRLSSGDTLQAAMVVRDLRPYVGSAAFLLREKAITRIVIEISLCLQLSEADALTYINNRLKPPFRLRVAREETMAADTDPPQETPDPTKAAAPESHEVTPEVRMARLEEQLRRSGQIK